MQRIFVLGLVAVGLAGLTGSAASVAADTAPATLRARAYLPGVSRGQEPPIPTPQPTAAPKPYSGPVASLYVGAAGVSQNAPVEERGTVSQGGREVFQDPSAPGDIAWYSGSLFGHPGFPGANSVFAAHINYFGYGDGPFAHLTNARADDALYVTMANGEVYTYTVRSVTVVPLTDLDNGGMQAIVYPALDMHTERVTLISCGGDFVPYNGSSGAGEYTSRVVLVAERYVP
jgi:hypothetical protein